MSEEPSTPAADGGRAQDMQIFGQIGDTEDVRASPGERVDRIVDMYIHAPLRIAWSDWRARIGGGIVLFWILAGTVGTVIVPEPTVNEGPRYVSPFQTLAFPLGTDTMGQSIGKQLVHATPAMLKMALAGVLFSAGIGVLVGVVAGYKAGTTDRVLMTVTDVVLTIPGLPLIIVIAAIFPPRDPFLVGVILAIDSWPGLARTLRSQVLTIREESYVESARAMGIPTAAILNREVLPQMAPYVLINAAGAGVGVISASVGLYFLGILPFTTLNWGVMMNFAHTTGQALVQPGRAGHWLFFPAFALSSLTFGLILFSQGMDRVFNPRIRARHAKTVSKEAGKDEDRSSPSTTIIHGAQK